MDFPQQIEETFLERPPSVYDVIMDSPLQYSITHNTHNNNKISTLSSSFMDKMTSSVNSTLDDTTPSDSGVQLLDSESSELMAESITSQTGIEFEDMLKSTPQNIKHAESAIIDDNSNVAPAANTNQAGEEAMTTSTCSTFDATENIVFRRKVRKTAALPKAPKKRVSFHEDILKNTRTDNIHIEHGFVTYKNGRKLAQHVGGAAASGVAGVAGRYSWCAERGGSGENMTNALCAGTEDDDDGNITVGANRRLVYRNACSDVLDYGNADIYDTNEPKGLRFDNSGVFEYLPQAATDKDKNVDPQLYRCSCSSSNSSLDSDEQDKNSNRKQYEQAKSSSCDCIGMNNANNNLINDNCYYSEPNIGIMKDDGSPKQKSVWNKEKKPKSSCLKKTKRHTNIIQEQDLNASVKKFNVHELKHQLLDNSSKMIFGSLKSIFTMPLPERGVPEGSEDLQTVVECIPEIEHKIKPLKEISNIEMESSPPLKSKPFLSKSLDGSKQAQGGVKQFVHNVDEQLRRKTDETLFAPTRNNSDETQIEEPEIKPKTPLLRQQEIDLNERETHEALAKPEFRNKFIINCESTVFEHTGVSYETSEPIRARHGNVASLLDKDTPIAQPAANQLRNTFIGAPIAKTFSNFFRSLKESATSPTTAQAAPLENRRANEANIKQEQQKQQQHHQKAIINLPTGQCSSTMPELSTLSSTNLNACSLPQYNLQAAYNNSLAIGHEQRSAIDKQGRHLSSPFKKRGSSGNAFLQAQPQRYGDQQQYHSRSLYSPDLFNNMPNAFGSYMNTRGGSGRDSKSTILSEEFDDILTITTTTDTGIDKQTTVTTDSDLVIVDYTDMCDSRQSLLTSSSLNHGIDYVHLLKPPAPQATMAKTSLINRFLRNVTQKKILETSIRKNDFFTDKLRAEQKLLSSQLYVPGARPKNYELIDDLNAEIAMEIEMSGVNSPRRELAVGMDSDVPGDMARFELGIGEISIDIFNGKKLTLLRAANEQLMKVFKLYTGYSSEGFMTPVLVFLTDKTLYVADLVRNCLCAKFVLPYEDLDVILMGPFGNTVLLCNSTRDMQQVLLAGGPYPADGLVANLELCARRSGSTLPAVGQLTLAHLAPLQSFVRANSKVCKNDAWMFYAVVNVPTGILGMGDESEQEPLGPHVKGFLMHRRIKARDTRTKMSWNPGYFLLKAGVLYMFNDSNQKVPSWAMALAECQGARRSVKAARPHCFEVVLKDVLLQLAAPDEYVASEWLQALLQSASGLFELQEKHKTLGCTLIVTENQLITLREDFTAPLRKLNKPKLCTNEIKQTLIDIGVNMTSTLEPGSLLSSAMSTPTRYTQRSGSSANSTPTKLSQVSRSTNTTVTTASATRHQDGELSKENYNNMSSAYGENCGLKILTCADIKAMTGIKISAHSETWWCILEFSCQEAPLEGGADDLVIFFGSSSEMQRFLRLVEQLWQAKNNDLFPITILDEDEPVAEQCSMLYLDINRAWEPLLAAALGYPL